MATSDLRDELNEALSRLQRTMDRCVLGLYGGMDVDGHYREGLIGQVGDLSRRVRDLETRRHHISDWLKNVSFLGIGALFSKLLDWAGRNMR